MRRWKAIAKATALEILSEPLSLLVLLAALALAALAPAFHYHQFGEASRMARDAGLSALFTCALAFAVFGTVRSFRRELETGTAEMALSRPVSRTAFLFSKIAGALAALAVFSFIVSAETCIIVNGAEIGGMIAAKRGDIARLWGPSFALGTAVIVLPLVVGALLNRFFSVRFVPAAFALAAVTAAGSLFYRFDAETVSRLVPVQLLVMAFVSVFLVAAAAFAVRFKANTAVSAVLLLAVLSVPFAGNYYLSDALSGGGRVPWPYVAGALAALIPAWAGFGLLAARFFSERDVG